MTNNLKTRLELLEKYGDKIEGALSAGRFDVADISETEIASLEDIGAIIKKGDEFVLSASMREAAEMMISN